MSRGASRVSLATASCVLVMVGLSASASADAPDPRLVEPEVAAPGSCHVMLHADSPVSLQSHPVGESHWTAVCTAPCDRELPLDADYRIAAEDLRTSCTLRLAASPGERVTLDVHPVSQRTHTTGLVLIATGLVLLVTGDAMSDVYLAFRGEQAVNSHPPPSFAADLVWPGLAIAGVGLVAFITGGVMFLKTREPTSVSQTRTPAAVIPTAAKPSTETAREDRWLRVPMWREAPRTDAPMPVSIPVVSFRF